VTDADLPARDVGVDQQVDGLWSDREPVAATYSVVIAVAPPPGTPLLDPLQTEGVAAIIGRGREDAGR
jgi:hypothetical protein